VDLVIETNKEHYQIGDVVSGNFIISTAKNQQVNLIYVDFFWHTSGYGNRDSETVEKVEFHIGMLSAGEHRFPFAFKLTHFPISYEGTAISINWDLTGYVDIPNALDQCTSKNLSITYSTAPDYHIDMSCCYEQTHGILIYDFNSSDSNSDQSNENSPKFFTETKKNIGLLSLCMICFYISFTIDSSIAPGVFLFGLFLSQVTYSSIRTQYVSRLFDNLELILGKDFIKRGDTIKFEFFAQPLRKLKIKNITVRLEKVEIAYRNKNKIDCEKMVHSSIIDEVIVLLDQEIEARQMKFIPGQIKFPLNGMHTFHSQNNSIEWQVVLDIDIYRCPAIKLYKNVILT
jgi:hypothetical protein